MYIYSLPLSVCFSLAYARVQMGAELSREGNALASPSVLSYYFYGGSFFKTFIVAICKPEVYETYLHVFTSVGSTAHARALVCV